MKNNIFVFLYLFILFVNLSSFGNTLTINNEEPKVGDLINVQYQGLLSKKNTKFYCVLFFKDFSRVTRTLATNTKENKIQATLVIPDSAVYFTFFVVNRSEIDNNSGQGFGFHIYENNKPVKYSYLMKGYNNKYKDSLFKGKIDYDEAAKDIEKELQLYPEMEEDCISYYYEVLLKIPDRRNETLSKVKEKLESSIVRKIDEKRIRFYASLYYQNNLKGLDSIKNVLIKIFPNGITNSEKKIYNIKHGQKSNTIFQDIDSLLRNNKQLANFQKLDLLQFKLAVTLFQNNKEIFESTLLMAQKEFPNIVLNSLLSLTFNDYADLYFKDNRLDLAYEFSKQSLRFFSHLDTLSVSYGNSLDTYASIIYSSGDLTNAIKYQSKAVELMNIQNDNANQRLIEYLHKAKNFYEIIQIGREIIICNTSTSTIDSLYENALKELQQEDIDFFKLKKANIQKNQTELLSKIKTQKAKDFALLDLNGKSVQLKDYQGKILIMDFWATWCKPCLASFPTMKKLQEEFKDKNVKFVYINTLENVSSSDSKNLTEKIKELAKIKNFSEFEILLDQKNPKTGSFNTSLDYNVQAIPAKFIIDHNGYLRYGSVGFGTEDKLKIELETIVNFLLLE
ncbi:TlpA_like_family domain containing protein [Spirosomataceae bacterium]|jgi:thiol-disulfide isomerase/thioredoxin